MSWLRDFATREARKLERERQEAASSRCHTPDCANAPIEGCDLCRTCNAAAWNLVEDDE